MARLTLQFKIQIRKPDTFLKLCEDIVAEHNELGAASPFAGGNLIDMPDFIDRVNLARKERNTAIEHYAIAEAAMARSRQLIGSMPGQYGTTPYTLLNYVLNIKKILLALNTVNPKALCVWGFEVVVRLARSSKKKKKATG